MEPQPDAQFQPTRWSLVLRVRGSDDKQRESALNDLCKLYWRPLYFFARQNANWGLGHEDAQDLVQGFIAKFIEDSSFESADPARGRFRTFLKHCFVQFCINWFRANGAKKRGGENAILSLDAPLEDEMLKEYVKTARDRTRTPDEHLDRAWAIACVDLAISRLEGKLSDNPKKREILLHFIQGRIFQREDSDAQRDQLIAEHGMTENALNIALTRMGDELKDIVRDTVASEADLEDEMLHLLAALRGGR